MTKEKKSGYGNESITALKGPDRVRKRPGVIFGSDGIEGCQHSVFEILSNSIDEAREGFGKTINVIRYKDKSISVEDKGRGMPLEYNSKEKRYNWELIFCELYAGGKYDNNTGTNYQFSLGLNGLGSCATQYSSEYTDVVVYSDGKRHDLHFEHGNNKGGLKTQKSDVNYTGTTIKWKPDLEVFTDIDIQLSYFQDILKKQAIVNPGITFKLYDEETNESFEYYYKKGIADYIAEISVDNRFTEIQLFETSTKGRDRADKPEYRLKMQIAFCFSNNNNILEYYHNSSFLEHGGSPDKAVKQGFTFAVDKLIRDSGKYNKNEPKISFTDIEDSLILISSSFSTETSYENQTKKSIANSFIQSSMKEFLKHKLEIYFIENKQEADRIIDQLLVNKRSRETAEKTRINIKKKLGQKIDIGNKVKKFVDCRTKEIGRRELYIVEGDSALGSCKLGRDSDFQAIMPVRGKILNCLKAGYESVFKSEIIIDLLKVLGCGVEIKTKHNKNSTFDIRKLNYSKVIICTDADYDGYHIRTLIITMLYRLVPSLLELGKVFIAETPLYEITSGGKTYFAFDENEKNKKTEELKGKYTVQRSKGLGENEPDMMWETTMNPESRRLIKIMPDDAVKTKKYFDLLFGDDLAGRKEYIQKNGHLYLDMIDVQ